MTVKSLCSTASPRSTAAAFRLANKVPCGLSNPQLSGKVEFLHLSCAAMEQVDTRCCRMPGSCQAINSVVGHATRMTLEIPPPFLKSPYGPRIA